MPIDIQGTKQVHSLSASIRVDRCARALFDPSPSCLCIVGEMYSMNEEPPFHLYSSRSLNSSSEMGVKKLEEKRMLW